MNKKTALVCLPGLLPNSSKITDLKVRRLIHVPNSYVTDAGGSASILRDRPTSCITLPAAKATRSPARLPTLTPALELPMDPSGLFLKSKCPWSTSLNSELSLALNATNCDISHQFFSIQVNLHVIDTHIAWFMFWNFLYVPPIGHVSPP